MPMPGSYPCLLFDFDGTLVDSAPGILLSLQKTLALHRINPRVELHAGIIGPPLLQTLATISGIGQGEKLASLARSFKQLYDSTGYRKTLAYPGADAMLRRLAEENLQLKIVTNKRSVPTHQVLAHLGWSSLFSGVHCLDAYPGVPDKATMLGALAASGCFSSEQTIFIGDTESDAHAAQKNGIYYLHVGWGYGKHYPGGIETIGSMGELEVLIRNRLVAINNGGSIPNINPKLPNQE